MATGYGDNNGCYHPFFELGNALMTKTKKEAGQEMACEREMSGLTIFLQGGCIAANRAACLSGISYPVSRGTRASRQRSRTSQPDRRTYRLQRRICLALRYRPEGRRGNGAR